MSRWINNAIDASSRGFGAMLGAMGAVAVVNSVQQQINNLGSTPNLIKCNNCGFFIPIPTSIWNWRCAVANCDHINSINEHSACAKCGAGKPPFPNPSVPCPQCSCCVEVASTKFQASLRRLVPSKRVPNPRAHIPVAAPIEQMAGNRPASAAAFTASSAPHAFPGAPSQIGTFGVEGAPNAAKGDEHILFEEQPGEDWTVLKKSAQS